MTLPDIWEEIRTLPSYLFKDRPGDGYPSIKADEILFRLRTEVDRSLQTYEGMVEARELVIAQHLKKFEAIRALRIKLQDDYAFSTTSKGRSTISTLEEIGGKGVSDWLKTITSLAEEMYVTECTSTKMNDLVLQLRDVLDLKPKESEETTEVEPEPDKYEAFKVFNYLKITEEAFNAMTPGICRHPECTRETGTGMTLCRWHSIAFGKWGKKMGAPTI